MSYVAQLIDKMTALGQLCEDEVATYPTMDSPDSPEFEDAMGELNKQNIADENDIETDGNSEKSLSTAAESDTSTSDSDGEGDDDDYTVTTEEIGQGDQDNNNNNDLNVKSYDSYDIDFHSLLNITQSEQEQQNEQNQQEPESENSLEMIKAESIEIPQIPMEGSDEEQNTRPSTPKESKFQEQQNEQNQQEWDTGNSEEILKAESIEIPRISIAGQDEKDSPMPLCSWRESKFLRDESKDSGISEPIFATRASSSTTFSWVNMLSNIFISCRSFKVTFAEKDETLYSSVASEEDGSANSKNSSTTDTSQGQVE